VAILPLAVRGISTFDHILYEEAKKTLVIKFKCFAGIGVKCCSTI